MDKGKVKKIFPVHAMKTYTKAELQFHSFLTSKLYAGNWTASRSSRFNYGDELRYSLNRRLGGPQSRSGLSRYEKNFLLLPGIETQLLRHSPHSLMQI